MSSGLVPAALGRQPRQPLLEGSRLGQAFCWGPGSQLPGQGPRLRGQICLLLGGRGSPRGAWPGPLVPLSPRLPLCSCRADTVSPAPPAPGSGTQTLPARTPVCGSVPTLPRTPRARWPPPSAPRGLRPCGKVPGSAARALAFRSLCQGSTRGRQATPSPVKIRPGPGDASS